MSKIFYDHLVIREEVIDVLNQYEITTIEREELVQLMDETLHLRILQVILTHLPKGKHREFLTAFHQRPHDIRLLDYLKIEASADIEAKIIDEAKKVKGEILTEIKRAKKSTA